MSSLADEQAGVDEHGQRAEDHAEVDSGFVEEAQPTVAGEFGERKWPQTVAEQDGQFGCDQGGKNNRQKHRSSIACIKIEQDRAASDDLDATHQWRQQMRVRQTESGEEPNSQLTGVHELEYAFGEKHQAHNHPNQDHG